MKKPSALLFAGWLLSLPAGALADSQEVVLTEQNGVRLQSLNRAYDLFIAGHLQRAAELWHRVALVHSGDRTALLGLAASSLALGDSRGFLQALAKMRESPAVHSEGFALEASTELVSPDESLASMQRLSERLPLSPLPPFALGVMHASLGHWQQACRDFARARSRAPGWPDIVYNLATCVDRLGEGSRAIRLYRQALALAEQKPAQFAADTLVHRLARLTGAEEGATGQGSKKDRP